MPHLWGEQLKMETGIKLEHIGYKGSADALKDVLGGHVMLFSDTLLPSGLAVKDGRLRGLVVAAAKRVPMLPDVPTVAEAGLPANLTGAVFFGVMATGGTPEPIIAKLNAAFNELLADPATSQEAGRSRLRAGRRQCRRLRQAHRRRDGEVAQGHPGGEDHAARLSDGAQFEPSPKSFHDLGDPPRKQKMLPVLFAQMWLRPSGASSFSTTFGGTCTQRPSSRAYQLPSSFW